MLNKIFFAGEKNSALIILKLGKYKQKRKNNLEFSYLERAGILLNSLDSMFCFAYVLYFKNNFSFFPSHGRD